MLQRARVLVGLLLAVLALASMAQAEPYAGGDASIGQKMVNQYCIECHARQFGGDGSQIYLRENRLVHTSRGLVAQIRNCNTMLGLKWFEDEELHVAKYLNQTYYKFEQ